MKEDVNPSHFLRPSSTTNFYYFPNSPQTSSLQQAVFSSRPLSALARIITRLLNSLPAIGQYILKHTARMFLKSLNLLVAIPSFNYFTHTIKSSFLANCGGVHTYNPSTWKAEAGSQV
jgi:hypothetical protein